MKTPIHAELIIFDLDGTLINSIPDLTDALNHVSKSSHGKEFSEKEVSGFVGKGVENLVEQAFSIDRSQTEFKTYFRAYYDYYQSHHSNLSYLYQGVSEMLQHFQAKKLAVLSNKLDAFTQQIVKDFYLDRYFDLVIGARNDLSKKPAAEPIEYILKELGTAPENAVMVGDSEPDILAAKNAGVKSIAVTYGFRSRAQLELLKPDLMIDRADELIELIQ